MTTPPGQPAADQRSEPGGTLVEYEQYIEDQLRRTRSHVRSVDIGAAVLVLAAGTLAFFFLAALADHWLFARGLGFRGRAALLTIYLAGSAYWIGAEIMPLLIKRINPLYAAETIERSRPSLKNTLLNFLLFRANPQGVHQKVLAAIEEQAATNLAGASPESAVDRTRLIRLGYVVVAILLVCAVYTLLSPKDLFRTVGRVAMPWADIEPPTRTTIDEITPGDVQAFRGQQVTIKARVQGLPAGGKVLVYYTTADRQIVDRAVEMQRPADDYQHAAVLPASDASLAQTLSYRIEAGDTATRTYTIEVVAAPTIVVEAVRYEYPAYTGLVGQRVEHQGDIKAIEGTRVTLEAVANQEIAAAHVDFDCDNQLDVRMQAQGQKATGAFTLKLAPDRQKPEHTAYQVLFKNQQGQANPQPVRHEIEVTRDIAPEIQFVMPQREEIDLPLDAAVDLEVVAADPDFALAEVVLSAALDDKPLVDEKLLAETWRGQFVKKYRFQPAKLGLRAGDVVDYWAAATDNKSPDPNRTVTARRRIRVMSPTGRQGQQDQLAQQEQRGDRQRAPRKDRNDGEQSEQPIDQAAPHDKQDKSQDSKPGEKQDDPRGQRQQQDDRADQQDQEPQSKDGQPGAQQDGSGAGEKSEPGDQQQGQGQPGDEQQNAGQQEGQQQNGQQQDGRQPPGQQPDRERVANDGTDDGEAFERILQHRDDQQGSQQTDKRDPNRSPGDPKDRQQGGPRQDDGDASQDAGAQESGDRQPNSGKSRSDGKQSPGEQAGDRSGQKSSSPQAPSEKSSGSDPQASDEAGQGESGREQGDDAKSAAERNPSRTRGDGSDSQQSPVDEDGGQPQKQDPRRQATRDNNTRADGTPEESAKGQGGQSQDDPMRKPGRPDGQPESREKPDARGGDGEQQKGESGAGQEAKDQQGSPRPQENSTPRSKTSRPGAEEKDPMRDSPEQSPSTTKRESDSQGQEDGDRSGGGKQGGGQKADKPGTGGAGENTAADEGAGRNEQSGDGETSDRAGTDRAADGQTGQSDPQSGQGSRTKPADGGNEQPGGSDAPQQESSQSPSNQKPSGQNNSGQGTAGGGNPSGGRTSGDAPPEQKWKPGVEQADQANLDYTRKATDLALEHLRYQLRKEQPDQDLLNRLGWTRDDLEKFVKRWESLKQQSGDSAGDGRAAGRELDDTLRSLGLRPRATNLKSNAARDDRAQGYQETRRTTPPAEYSESFKAYTQGTARGGK